MHRRFCGADISGSACERPILAGQAWSLSFVDSTVQLKLSVWKPQSWSFHKFATFYERERESDVNDQSYQIEISFFFFPFWVMDKVLNLRPFDKQRSESFFIIVICKDCVGSDSGGRQSFGKFWFAVSFSKLSDSLVDSTILFAHWSAIMMKVWWTLLSRCYHSAIAAWSHANRAPVSGQTVKRWTYSNILSLLTFNRKIRI